MKIKNIVVILRNGTDLVTLYTELPCPFTKAGYPEQPNLKTSFEATQYSGSNYCIEHFGITPEIIDAR